MKLVLFSTLSVAAHNCRNICHSSTETTTTKGCPEQHWGQLLLYTTLGITLKCFIDLNYTGLVKLKSSALKWSVAEIKDLWKWKWLNLFLNCFLHNSIELKIYEKMFGYAVDQWFLWLLLCLVSHLK